MVAEGPKYVDVTPIWLKVDGKITKLQKNWPDLVQNECRLGAGSRYQKSKLPDKPLELWSYELSPFCKVRWPILAAVLMIWIRLATPAVPVRSAKAL